MQLRVRTMPPIVSTATPFSQPAQLIRGSRGIGDKGIVVAVGEVSPAPDT